MKRKKVKLVLSLSVLSALVIPSFIESNKDVVNAAEKVNPIARYEFKDASNPGKDSMGNYDLVSIGNVSVNDGVATFDGQSMLQSKDQNEDLGEVLDSFTLAFEIKTTATNGDWATPIGFGWNDWSASKHGVFEFSGSSDLLRFTANGVAGASSQWWGNEIGSIGTSDFHKVILSAKQGGKMNVYLDGALKYSYDMPEGYTFSDNQMKFAIGGTSVWNNDVVYTPFTGDIKKVDVYDFAMDQLQVAAYGLNGDLDDDDLAEQEEVAAFAKYEFNDASNPGKDSAGNHDLVSVGNVSVNDGVATFDGQSMLQSKDQNEDLGEVLTSFTLAYDIKTTATNGDWATPIGFGWNDWSASKFGTFEFSGSSDLLRFTANGIAGASSQWWGNEIGSIGTSDFHRVILTAKQGGKMNVYLDGVLKYSYDMPEGYTFSDNQMKFAIGGTSVWNNDVVYTPFTGDIKNVTIYDDALSNLQVAQYQMTGKVYNALTATVSSAMFNLSDSIIVDENASDAEILASAPKSSTLDVLMSNGEYKEALIKWTNVTEIDGGKFLEGDISGVVNTDNIKAYAKISLKEANVLAPIAHYEFNDPSNPGKDSMGRYDLTVKASDDNANPTVSVSDGVATFDGSAGLVALDDFSDSLNAFTLVYSIKGYGTSGSWGEPVGFGWNDWGATKWATFMIAGGSNDLRYTASNKIDENTGLSDVDGNQNPYWGTVVGTLSDSEFATVVLSVVPGGKMNVYVNGKLGYSYDTPEDFTLENSSMYFSIGANGTWGACRSSFVGQIADVAIYDFAANDAQVAILSNGFEIKDLSCTDTYIVSVFENISDVADNLNDTMSLLDMYAALKECNVIAALSNGETFALPVSWNEVSEEDGKYYAVGTYQLIGKSMATTSSYGKITKELNVEVVKYDVTCKDAANGSFKVSETNAKHDSIIEVTPVANKGYEVDEVKVNGNAIEAKDGKYSFALTENSEVEVTFKKCVYEVSLKDVFDGAVSLSENKAEYESVITIKASANDGYEVDEVKVNGNAIEAKDGVYSFTLTENSEVEVTFKEIPKKGCKSSAVPSFFGLMTFAAALLLKKKR